MKYVRWSMCLVLLLLVGNVSIALNKATITIARPLQSSNSLMKNDCNLSLDDASWLKKRFGEKTTFFTSDEILMAYNYTVHSTSCWWQETLQASEDGNTWQPSFIANLCILGLAKLAPYQETTPGHIEQPYGVIPHPDTLARWKRVKTEWIWAQWIIPTLATKKLRQIMWYDNDWFNINKSLKILEDPDNCWQFPDSSVATVYKLLPDAIREIATDCWWSKTNNPDRNKLLSKDSNNVFGYQNWWTNIDTEIQNCRKLIENSYATLLKSMKNIEIIQGNAYIDNSTIAYTNQLKKAQDVINESYTKSIAGIADTKKQTPDTQRCEA